MIKVQNQLMERLLRGGTASAGWLICRDLWLFLCTQLEVTNDICTFMSSSQEGKGLQRIVFSTDNKGGLFLGAQGNGRGLSVYLGRDLFSHEGAYSGLRCGPTLKALAKQFLE